MPPSCTESPALIACFVRGLSRTPLTLVPFDESRSSTRSLLPSANPLGGIQVCLRDPLNGQNFRVGRVASREERDETAEEGGAAAVHSRKAGRPPSTWTISNSSIRVPASSPSPNSVTGRFLGESFELVLASLDGPRAKPAKVDSQWSRESLALLSPNGFYTRRVLFRNENNGFQAPAVSRRCRSTRVTVRRSHRPVL